MRFAHNQRSIYPLCVQCVCGSISSNHSVLSYVLLRHSVVGNVFRSMAVDATPRPKWLVMDGPVSRIKGREMAGLLRVCMTCFSCIHDCCIVASSVHYIAG
jgi:hypothetical protein